jgi:hypothetical protein
MLRVRVKVGLGKGVRFSKAKVHFSCLIPEGEMKADI